jgi:hypothetical protein
MLQALKHKGLVAISQGQVYLGLILRAEQLAWSKLWRHLPLTHRAILSLSLLGTFAAVYGAPYFTGRLIDGLAGARGLGVVLNDLYSTLVALFLIIFSLLFTHKYFNQYEGASRQTLDSSLRFVTFFAIVLWGCFHGWFIESLIILLLKIFSTLKNNRLSLFLSTSLSFLLIVNIFNNSLGSIAARAVTIGEGLQIICWLFIFSTLLIENCLHFLYRK